MRKYFEFLTGFRFRDTKIGLRIGCTRNLFCYRGSQIDQIFVASSADIFFPFSGPPFQMGTTVAWTPPVFTDCKNDRLGNSTRMACYSF
jgi:hypothetical protein